MKFDSENATLFDSDRNEKDTVTIDGANGLYLYGKPESSILTWAEEGYGIVGYCEKDELIKMAESPK